MKKVLKKDVIGVCEALGFATCRKWSKGRMAKKLVDIAELAGDPDADMVVEDEDLAAVLKQIVAANGEVEVVEDASLLEADEAPEAEETEEAAEDEDETAEEDEADDEESEEDEEDEDAAAKPEPAKPAKVKKVKKEKPAKEPKAKKEKPVKAKKEVKAKETVDKDTFGSRIGSKLAAINACLSKKPKLMKALMEEAGVGEAYYNHLRGLIEKGLVEKTDKGYRLIK